MAIATLLSNNNEISSHRWERKQDFQNIHRKYLYWRSIWYASPDCTLYEVRFKADFFDQSGNPTSLLTVAKLIYLRPFERYTIPNSHFTILFIQILLTKTPDRKFLTKKWSYCKNNILRRHEFLHVTWFYILPTCILKAWRMIDFNSFQSCCTRKKREEPLEKLRKTDWLTASVNVSVQNV